MYSETPETLTAFVWIIVGQGPIVLAVGAGGGLFGHSFSHLPPSL